VRASEKMQWLEQVASDTHVTSTACRVAVFFASRRNPKNAQCNPSHGYLADKCNKSNDAIIRAIANLEHCGHLKVKRTKFGGQNAVNKYQLVMLNSRKNATNQDSVNSRKNAVGIVAKMRPGNIVSKQGAETRTPLEGGSAVVSGEKDSDPVTLTEEQKKKGITQTQNLKKMLHAGGEKIG